MSYLRVTLLILCLSFITGCSSLAGAAASSMLGGSAPSLDAELVVGQKTTDYNGKIGDDITAEVINNIQDIPTSFLLIAILGWILPSPIEIWKGIWSNIGNMLLFIRRLIKGG